MFQPLLFEDIEIEKATTTGAIGEGCHTWTPRPLDADAGAMERDESTLVIALSDHGFGPFRRCVDLNAWLHAQGLLALAPGVSRSGITITTAAIFDFPVPPVKKLREAGVNVACGHDDIRDLWSPFGSGDLLERAVRQAASTVAVPCPALDDDQDVTLTAHWGEQLDVRHITEAGDDDKELSAEQVAGYVAKYATKGQNNQEHRGPGRHPRPPYR